MNSMTNVLVWLGIAGSISFAAPTAQAQEPVAEKILFFQSDGRSYVKYMTVRSSDPVTSLGFDKDQTESKALSDVLYLNPKDYRWDTSDPLYNQVTFPRGSFALMTTGVLSEVTTAPDGAMRYTSWAGKPDSNGNYGEFTTRQGGFADYASVWVFPENFEIVKYESNRRGDWKVRNNTVAFYGRNVNDLIFTLEYRPRTAPTYAALRKSVDEAAVDVKQIRGGVKMTIAATVLFPSGGAELSTAGQTALTTIAATLRKRHGVTVAVEGHTDDAPIAGSLVKSFPTNWEVSAARALTVVRFLASQGLAESALEARALGATHPIAPNTERDRHRNRRIELLVMDELAVGVASR